MKCYVIIRNSVEIGVSMARRDLWRSLRGWGGVMLTEYTWKGIKLPRVMFNIAYYICLYLAISPAIFGACLHIASDIAKYR